ncbi:hypothetical protein AMS68_002307 [Peltaster fructicola]|uniref:Nitroreductase domain-containing protein n=1 Tax=Peltaster fructicola TaxID=286661 RepID=A0A6H0XQP6_9PEZI|nr:hypothetical protein AMS68_002307 [Peltaster fructicola]
MANSNVRIESLEECIRARHSIRQYTNKAVPQELLLDSLALAQLAPSNSNIQNWRVHFASGAARDRIVEDMLVTAKLKGPNVPALPEHFKHFRSEFGHELYGARGYNIPRHDKEGLSNARLRNYEFFGAPVIGVISMHQDLAMVDAMSVGMFVQTLMLALTERGLGTCLQVSVAGYPEVLKRGFKLEHDQMILCGICIGWPAVDAAVNNMHIGREDIAKEITFLTE